MISYSNNESDECEIYSHLIACDGLFVPKLSQKVNLEAYSKKLHNKAICFEAWDKGHLLVGLVAFYIQNSESLFITNVSVLPSFQGKGIAKKLINQVIFNAISTGKKKVVLEVSTGNYPALTLYKGMGFETIGIQEFNENQLMIKYINEL